MHWEDFVVQVIRARKPYTKRELEQVISEYAQGIWEMYSYEHSDNFGLQSQVKAEREAEWVRRTMLKEAQLFNNLPQ